MKMKAIFEIEFEAEGGFASPRHLLQRALTRAERGLKEIIEDAKPGSSVRTGIKRNSTRIAVKNKDIEG
jgi:hypothetical protein